MSCCTTWSVMWLMTCANRSRTMPTAIMTAGQVQPWTQSCEVDASARVVLSVSTESAAHAYQPAHRLQLVSRQKLQSYRRPVTMIPDG
ncbi:hypothetical protein COO60DRAFT_3788 [Scenedesmus sp. NREL 46B-D3]|nr:hypothetical protein COO60DRAFT_3788 [Scenedesmus sp. NREL 46B-D3]